MIHESNQPDSEKEFEEAFFDWLTSATNPKFSEAAKFGRDYSAKELEAVQFKLELQKDFVKVYSGRVQELESELAELKQKYENLLHTGLEGEMKLSGMIDARDSENASLKREREKLRAALVACSASWLPPEIRLMRREALKDGGE